MRPSRQFSDILLRFEDSIRLPTYRFVHISFYFINLNVPSLNSVSVYLSICAKSPTINNSIYQWIARLLSPRYSGQWILELINTFLRTGILDAAHALIYMYIDLCAHRPVLSITQLYNMIVQSVPYQIKNTHIILEKPSIFCKKYLKMALHNFLKWFILLKLSD